MKPLLTLLFLASLVGFVTGQPSAFERQAYYVTTNWVPEVRGHIILSNNVVTGTNYFTQMVGIPHLEPRESVKASIQTGGTIGTMLGFGPSGIIASILVGLYGAWAKFRNVKSERLNTVLSQGIETAREIMTLTSAASVERGFVEKVKSEQVKAGVKSEAAKVSSERVDTGAAKEAAADVLAVPQV